MGIFTSLFHIKHYEGNHNKETEMGGVSDTKSGERNAYWDLVG
jgi:hypothetical protein